MKRFGGCARLLCLWLLLSSILPAAAGWIEDRKDPLSYMEDCYVPRMGPEMAEWGMKEELKNYSHFVLIDTGAGNLENLRRRAQ